jgi:hypothetical protein
MIPPGIIAGGRNAQWDGGADNVIHGKWSRTLPTLRFDDVRTEPDAQETQLIVTLVADGAAPRILRMPVRVLPEAEYSAHCEEHDRRLSGSTST